MPKEGRDICLPFLPDVSLDRHNNVSLIVGFQQAFVGQTDGWMDGSEQMNEIT